VAQILTKDLLETCEAAARAGGRELQAWRGRFKFREKGISDYVTDADVASQAAIRRVIHERFPSHTFIGEEQPPDTYPDSDEICWIVDPLDGTTNYLHGYPYYATSVAVSRGRELLAGVIYDPNADACYAAATGQGAWHNNVGIRTSNTEHAGDALIAVSLRPRVPRNDTDLLDFIEATQVCRGVRRSGSAALNLANVASGTLDAFWASHIHPWDVAAGVLMIHEAGGLVTARNGGAFDLWNPAFLAAATQQLHQNLFQSLTPIPKP
jgi:myo-inositol-1(or 4)-monophosphatase